MHFTFLRVLSKQGFVPKALLWFWLLLRRMRKDILTTASSSNAFDTATVEPTDREKVEIISEFAIRNGSLVCIAVWKSLSLNNTFMVYIVRH